MAVVINFVRRKKHQRAEDSGLPVEKTQAEKVEEACRQAIGNNRQHADGVFRVAEQADPVMQYDQVERGIGVALARKADDLADIGLGEVGTEILVVAETGEARAVFFKQKIDKKD